MFSQFSPDETVIDTLVEPALWSEPERPPEICIVSTAFIEEYDLKLGDTVDITVSDGNAYWGKTVRIIGAYVKQGSADNIYAPLSSYHVTEKEYIKVDGIRYTHYTDISASVVFSRDLDSGILHKLTFSSFSFKMQGAENLGRFKDYLYTHGYSEVNKMRGARSVISIEDKMFHATERAMSQRLWYMEKIFPVLFVLIELLAALIPFILIKLRRRELALMRVQGAAKRTAFFSLFYEQLMLCATGVIIGAAALSAASTAYTGEGVRLAALFALFWLFGTCVSVITSSRGSVRSLLKADE